GLLFALLLALFYVMWRDYHSAAREAEASKRTYGRIVVMHELDGTYSLTGDTYPLLPVTTMGRSPTNTIRIDDNFASGEHAVMMLRNGQWWLEDRHSRNGTMLNGMPVTQPVIVTDGDVVGVGHLHFRLELES